MALEYSYGLEGSGLYFKIVVTEVGGVFTAKVEMIEGKMDLNALWFSDGDGVGNEIGSTSLSKSNSSQNMNGASFDGEAVVWDGYQSLSNAGLGSAGEDKNTFLSEGDSMSFQLTGITDFAQIGLIGVRATSVTGGGYEGGSIKWVDDGEVPPPPPPPDDFFKEWPQDISNAVFPSSTKFPRNEADLHGVILSDQ